MSLTKRILLIEDTADVRTLYAELLRDLGYDVVEASDGVDGVEKATTLDWDLLLLDIMLPGLDGIEILKRIKAVPLLTSRPIILLTALDNEPLITKCFELGVDSYLIKSEVTPEQLVDEVKKFVS